MTKNMNAEKKIQAIGSGVNTEVNQLKTLIDQKNNSMRNMINGLDDIRHEIDRKYKELTEIDRKESEELTETEKRSAKQEADERKDETNRFIKTVNDVFKTP